MTTTYVLYIEFGNDPPRVKAFDTLTEADANLDYFETEHDTPLCSYHYRIFECRDGGWGTEIDINAFREKELDEWEASGLSAGEWDLQQRIDAERAAALTP